MGGNGVGWRVRSGVERWEVRGKGRRERGEASEEGGVTWIVRVKDEKYWVVDVVWRWIQGCAVEGEGCMQVRVVG